MAEALISVLLDPLVSITTEFLKEKVELVKGVRDDVTSLKSKLEALNTVLRAAEKKQLEDDCVRRWLDQLRDVSYDVDNVLDKWNTEILRSEIQKQNDPDSKKKVCFPLPSSCFCLSRLKQVGIHYEVAKEIKKLNETLQRIDEDRHRYSLETTNVVLNKRRETTSFVDVSEVYGRDADKEYLISKLRSDSSSHGGKVPVIIPIVGMGGIGKTTLAQLAFNDDEVKANFNERAWVCVSEPFDEIGIAKAILQELQVGFQELDILQALLRRIHESIEGKKFLVVLDDVWTEDREKWEQFILPFRSGAAGSRLLVTTRNHKVATIMGVATQMIINLELLSEQHCWSIFSRLAFFERNSEEREQLEGIGREIAKKCKGLPLEAKTLGGLMCFKEAKRDWEDVLYNQIWKLQDNNIKHFAPFLLSYYNLPPLEKRCFSYCSVFPKDYEFDRDELIHVWMSQGYFSRKEKSEDEGRNCFKNLAMQSFFQDFQKDDCGSIVGCKMHDILHDLAQFLTKNECFTMKINGGDPQHCIGKKVRHLTLLLTLKDEVEFPTSMLSEGNLHSLVFISKSVGSSLRLPHHTSHPLRYLRTLNMSNCGILWLPGELIGQLRQLRYLSLSDNYKLKKLPDEVSDLCNLQTLRLTGCFGLERLPEGMGKLANLRHLHISGCNRLKGLPKGIGRLTQLRTLDCVVIPGKNHEEYVSMGDLEKLKHFQFESNMDVIGCANFKSLSEVEKLAGLLKRGNHIGVYLLFRRATINKEDDEFQILEALQPHPSLKSLDIRGYLGANLSPKWMTSLHNLTRLQFRVCVFFETFPPLGRLPSLEYLKIYGNRELRKIGGEVMGIKTTTSSSASSSTSTSTSSNVDDINVAKGGGGLHHFISFPKLKQLFFMGMSRWEEWVGCESTTNMPCLESLEIHTCDSLKSLPEFLKETPLKHVNISCKILSKSIRRSGKEWAPISHVPNITIDHRVVKWDGNWTEGAFSDA